MLFPCLSVSLRVCLSVSVSLPLCLSHTHCICRHHVKGGFSQSLLLAGPGVLIGAFIMGSFVYYVIPVDWNWNLCMVRGWLGSGVVRVRGG